MDILEIEKLIKLGESSSLEFKKSLSDLDKIGKTISSFVNTNGGIILIGVSDNKQILGLEITDSTQKKLANLRNQFDPIPDMSIKYVPIPGSNKSIISISCEAFSPDKTTLFKGRAFLRNESTIQLMSLEDIKDRYLDSDKASSSWESRPSKYTIDNLDHDEILKTMKIGIREGRINDSCYTMDIKEILIHLGLYTDGALNNAAFILFGKNLFQKHQYSHSYIRMGRFLDDGMNNLLDSKQMSGNAFQILAAAEDFIRNNLPITSHLREDSFERVDEMALPPLAIREALINSIIHRDYAKGYGDISIKIFNTHLEIYNIGKLYGKRKLKDLKTTHPSLRRNQLISNAFFCRKLIDQWGSGIGRIQNDCSIRNIPIPTFSEYAGGIALTFKFKKPIGPLPMANDNNVKIPLSNRQKDILKILNNKERLTTKSLIQELKEPAAERTLRRDLSYLKKNQIIRLEPSGKGSIWVLNTNINT